MSQLEKARTFFALHQSGTFIMPNAWDAGSAKILAAHGFKALGTTSGGFAFGLGRPDALSAVSLDEALGNIAEIAAAVDIPVSADFENGYADDPADVADNVRRCVAAGAAGCSDIEKVLSHAQREAIVRGYASTAGFAAPSLAAVRA